MLFYRLSHPKYRTDREYDKFNSIRTIENFHIPSIVCENCGIWASSDRIRTKLDDSKLEEFREICFLEAKDWYELRPRWAEILEIEESVISPGAAISRPEATIFEEGFPDVLHPFPGQMIVRELVFKILSKYDLTGVDCFPVISNWGDGLDTFADNPPKLWELIVSGVAWRQGVDEYSIIACPICKRTDYPNKPLLIDQTKWDRQDFFHIDCNSNMVVVTDKVRVLFGSFGISNVAFFPCEN